MFKELGTVTLKTGGQVEAGVVVCPDTEWADRVAELLDHKGDPWNWQNSQLLGSSVGIEGRFYVLHCDGVPFANILTSELGGVGILGHVWTIPEERQKGACTRLMEIQMADFRARGGKALFLGTWFDSVPYHIYRRFGFEGIEPRSGYMEWYATTKEAFEGAYFDKGETEIQPIQWRHWPSSAALFLGDVPCVVRCAPLKLVGRQSTEGPLLPLLRDAVGRTAAGETPRGMVLFNKETAAVVGLAAWDWHPLWPDTALVDLFCHPNHRDRAGELFVALSLPAAERYIAYGDAGCAFKSEVLLDQGFQQTTVLKDRVPHTRAKTSFLDVTIWEKT